MNKSDFKIGMKLVNKRYQTQGVYYDIFYIGDRYLIGHVVKDNVKSPYPSVFPDIEWAELIEYKQTGYVHPSNIIEPMVNTNMSAKYYEDKGFIKVSY